MLKNETTSRIDRVAVNAYYQTEADARNDVYTITLGKDGCRLEAAGGTLRMTINGHVIFDDVSATNSNCNARFNNRTYRMDNIISSCGEACRPALINDAGAYKYSNRIRIFLNGSDNNTNGVKQQIMLKIRAKGPGEMELGRRAVFGNPVGSNERSFGVVEKQIGPTGYKSNPSWSAALAFPFALPCGADNPRTPAGRRMTLYDTDAQPGAFGVQYFYVMRKQRDNSNADWVKLEQNQYVGGGENIVHNPGSGFDGGVNWDEATKRWVNMGGEGAETRVPIRTYDVNYRYMLFIDLPDNRTQAALSPLGNVYSVNVPGETIHGLTDNCDYFLDPEVPLVDDTYRAGSTLEVRSTINNESAVDPGSGHSWETYIARYDQLPSDLTITPRGRDDGNDPNAACAAIPSADRTICRRFDTGEYPHSVALIPPSITSDALYDTSSDSGRYICFFTRVLKPRNTSPDERWRYSSRMACSRLGQAPRVQVWGNDVRSGGKIDVTSPSLASGRYYGSWAEYGAFSTGYNLGFATGSTLAQGGLSSVVSDRHLLTFANTVPACADNDYGCYGAISPPDALLRQLQARCDAAGPWLGDIEVDDWDHRGDIVCSTGTVTIKNNINNPSDMGTLRQKIIMARDIVIEDDVSRIDAWLVALPQPNAGLLDDLWGNPDPLIKYGRINTCHAASNDWGTLLKTGTGNNLATGVCDELLTITGPVIADQLYLARTGGGTLTDPEVPAEIMNLRADAFVWAFNGNSGSADDPVAQTLSVQELPPRF